MKKPFLNLVVMWAVGLLILGVGIWLFLKTSNRPPLELANGPHQFSTSAAPSVSSSADASLYPPLSSPLSRLNKKPFGLKVSPGHSPVSPERFSGYHTGVDLETTNEEANVDVAVSAACTGKVLLAKWASGYGGVVAQQCQLKGQGVTIIYGHLNIASVKVKVGDNMTAGTQFANLGQGYSQQTDGERKHLHFGIHKGMAVDILGYVQKQSDLSSWLDPAQYLR